MAAEVRKISFSKEKWLEAALNILAREGVDKLTINNLSRTVGVAKTSFYWHFKDRQDLLNHMLNYWASEFTLKLTEKAQLPPLDPAQRLQAITDAVIEQKLLKYELAIRSWASHDKPANAVLENVYGRRMEVIRMIFADAGFDKEEQIVRTQTFFSVLTWGGVIQGEAHSHKMIVERLIPVALIPMLPQDARFSENDLAGRQGAALKT